MTSSLSPQTELTSLDTGAPQSAFWTTKVLLPIWPELLFDIIVDCWISHSAPLSLLFSLLSPSESEFMHLSALCPPHSDSLTPRIFYSLFPPSSAVIHHHFIMPLLSIFFPFDLYFTACIFSLFRFFFKEAICCNNLVDRQLSSTSLLCSPQLLLLPWRKAPAQKSAQVSTISFWDPRLSRSIEAVSRKWWQNDPVFFPLHGFLPSVIPNYPSKYSQDLHAIRKSFSICVCEREGGCE